MGANIDLRARLAFYFAISALALVAILVASWTPTDLTMRVLLVVFCTFIVAGATYISLLRVSEKKSVRVGVLALLTAIIGAALSAPKRTLDIALKLSGGDSLGIKFSSADEGGGFLAPVAVIGVLAVVLVLLNYRKSRPAVGEPEKAIHEVLPHASDLERLATLRTQLLHSLDLLDRDTRWSDVNFVGIEAEVQVIDGKHRGPRVEDMLSALKRDRSPNLIVILGEPGSGKSVALRKLARELLRDSGAQSRIPLYINLRDWRAARKWTPGDRPTMVDFDRFVLGHALEPLELGSQTFLRENFTRLKEAGFFFFLFDSFDEIPAVLDSDERSWVIDHLSDLLSGYILGGHKSRGIVASRQFRRPRLDHKERSVWEIRPLSDDKILEAIRKAAKQSETLSALVMTRRPDLGQIAKNPFLLHLLISYFNARLSPPSSQAELFSSYFDINFEMASYLDEFSTLNHDHVLRVAEQIASFMFEGGTGSLSVSLTALENQIADPELRTIIFFLARARIARLGSGNSTVAFSHRRFHEYFLVRTLDGREKLPLTAIQEDSRWRDALALYSEVASVERAREIAEFAWKEVDGGFGNEAGTREGPVSGLRALKFLVEAFRNRKEVLLDLDVPVKKFIDARLESSEDYIVQKLAVDAIALLPAKQAEALACEVLETHLDWIAESAARSLRYQSGFSRRTNLQLYNHAVSQPGFEGLSRAKKAAAAYRLADRLRLAAGWLNFYVIDYCRAVLVAVVVAVLFWPTALLTFLAATGYWVLLTLRVPIPFPRFLENSLPTPQRKAKKPQKRPELARVVRRVLNSSVAAENAWLPIVLFYAFLLPVFFLGVKDPISDQYLDQHSNLAAKLWPSGSSVDFAISLSILWLLGIVPSHRPIWTSLFHLRLKSIWADVASMIPIFLGGLAVSGVIFAAGYAIGAWVPHGELIIKVIIFGFGAMMATILGVGVWMAVMNFLTDWRSLRSASSAFVPRRVEISETFLRFKTEYGRRKYVDLVERLSRTHIEEMRKVSNNWPPSGRPSISHAVSSYRLARLDARWQNLE